MKKKLLLLLLLVPALVITGCGKEEKKLSCTLTNDSDGVTSTSVMNIDFKGNTAKKITLDINITYPDEYKSLADTFKQSLESQRSGLEKVGYKVTITSEDNAQKLNATATDETLDKSESKGSYEATKKSLEDTGYVCK